MAIDPDPYLLERLHLAFDETPGWQIEPVPPDALSHSVFTEKHSSEQLNQSIVVFVPVRLLPRIPRYSWPIVCHGTALSLETLEPDAYDDAIVSDWSSAELRFRLRRLLRSTSIACGERTLSWGPHWVSGNRTPVRLTRPQFTILVALLRAGRAGVPRDALFAVLEANPASSSRRIDMQVSRLRRRLAVATQDWTHSPRIVSMRSRGYCLEFPFKGT